MNIPLALRRIFPRVNQGAGPSPSRDYQAGWLPGAAGQPLVHDIVAWHPNWPIKEGETYPDQPTPEQLTAALNPPPSPRDIAAAAFKALPLGKQALMESVRSAVDTALGKNDNALAVEILKTVPNLYDGMEDDRAHFLSLFGVK